ncbi:MAG: hypothetical protein ABSH48_27570, partial [Verrucomicrobiota bacterium]
PDESALAAFCQQPDILPQDNSATADAAPGADYEVGTVIAVGVSHDKIVIAADSRNTQFFKKRLPDGTFATETKYDDCACKVTQLTPTMLFAGDGLVRANDTTPGAIPGAILYDAHRLARLAARSYHSNPQEEEVDGGKIAAIANHWAWDVDFRMRHGFAKGWTPVWAMTLEGIFAGLESDGEIAIAVAKLEYPKPRPGLSVPPVTLTVGRFQAVPTEVTWVRAFGMNDVAQTYYFGRTAAEQARDENKRISSEIQKDPKLFDPRIPELLVDLTIRSYQSAAGLNGPLYVHGPIDSAVLERKKEITWIHKKQCSIAAR